MIISLAVEINLQFNILNEKQVRSISKSVEPENVLVPHGVMLKQYVDDNAIKLSGSFNFKENSRLTLLSTLRTLDDWLKSVILAYKTINMINNLIIVKQYNHDSHRPMLR